MSRRNYAALIGVGFVGIAIAVLWFNNPMAYPPGDTRSDPIVRLAITLWVSGGGIAALIGGAVGLLQSSRERRR